MAAGEAVKPRPRPVSRQQALHQAVHDDDVRPLPRPDIAPPSRPKDGIGDLGRAVPAHAIGKLPPAAEQYRDLRQRIDQTRPELAKAKDASQTLARETVRLQRQLVATAGEVQVLEAEALALGADIVRLGAEEIRLGKSFAADRKKTVRLLAVLERLQHGLPPALVLKSEDALAATRSAMLMGAGLPRIYAAAADLARKIDALRRTRQNLVEKREAAARNAKRLAQARIQMARLLAIKRVEADSAADRYGTLKQQMDKAAAQAADLEILLKRIAALRAAPSASGVVVVTASDPGGRRPGGLLRPLAGSARPGGIDGVGGAAAPGMTFFGVPDAAVVAPADGEVRFAGPYHHSGRLLILRISGEYDAVLAGMERLDVRLGDRVLAGEPVGRMAGDASPRGGAAGRSARRGLYFELRHQGRGLNPAPFLAGGG